MTFARTIRITSTLTNGITTAWNTANKKNDAFVADIFGDKLNSKQIERYINSNAAALSAFQKRKEAGLKLSDRIWNYSQSFKSEMEMALDEGLSSGKSAHELALELYKSLKNPNVVISKYRDKWGQVQLNEKLPEKSGQGVYRSSYKNALRFTRTEINSAYHTADYLRWQQMDFVVGIEVILSNNHTLNGKPFTDICDDLQGKYPKDFKFTGWHPQCRCIAVSILKEEDEIIADAEAIMDGEEPSTESVNTVTDVPDGFKWWITTNESRIAAAEKRGTLPYFIRDNYKDGKYANGFAFATIDKDRAAYGSLIENLTLSDYSREDIPKRGIVNSPSIYYENPDKVTKNDLQFLLENYFESSDINGRFSSVTIKAGASKEFMMAARDVKAGKRDNDHNYLELTNHNFMITKDKKIMFNPSEELLNALQQIRNGKTLTFKEEYAVENLWHEIMHMKSKGWVDYKLKKEPAITAMEVVNQMTARSTYNEFLHSLGGKAVHKDLIVTSGFGYHHEINRFTKLLTDNKIDADVFVNDFKNLIYTEKYEDIYKKMIEYLEKNGIKNAKEALTHVF